MKNKQMTRYAVMLLVASCVPFSAVQAENRIDIIRADAPELAAYGEQAVGVRQIDFVHKNQIDVLNTDRERQEGDAFPYYDRPLTVETWYPAQANSKGSQVLKVFARDGKTEIELHGQAILDAEPAKVKTAFPLVILSHGYPGNRFLMSPIAENIASKGYVVVAIDHTDSTYSTLSDISSSIVNRTKDQLFILDQISQLAKDKSSFLYNLVDTNNTGIIGYSMGGYGTVVTVGGGLTSYGVNKNEGFFSAPNGTLDQYLSGSEDYLALADSRIKTAVTFAPAGMNNGFMDAKTAKGIRVPMLYIAGSVDDTVGYEDGVRALWKASTSVDRALLTFDYANHNAGAPMAPPAEMYKVDPELGFNLSMHYLDPVWDNVRMNNVSTHFITAWLGQYLKHDDAMSGYLDLVPHSNEGTWGDGEGSANHTYWKGFPNRSASGLRFETLKTDS
ncbi:alpha/beta hydrolase family protein [Marinomonas rhizomae]|uniref:alpha/beta hydrolase family protein n=1 Tax=Marinomonas rhizomae TaxID=491948 RepID=UPI0021082D5C|nr:dienelactone hydrolase [Marinomonas rhizomae]